MTFSWLWIAVFIGAIFVYLNTVKAKKDISDYKKNNQENTDEDIYKNRR
ncbi:hypothetical protein [uncultured Aquimarina sp.]|jgi:hypothetical protein|nr:hypothetical protein [uncultured Aquimarina sp.]